MLFSYVYVQQDILTTDCLSVEVSFWNEIFPSVFLQHVYMPQATLSTAVQPPTSVRSPRGDASRARPAASWSVWLWACWGRVREKVSSLSSSVSCATCSILGQEAMGFRGNVVFILRNQKCHKYKAAVYSVYQDTPRYEMIYLYLTVLHVTLH